MQAFGFSNLTFQALKAQHTEALEVNSSYYYQEFFLKKIYLQ